MRSTKISEPFRIFLLLFFLLAALKNCYSLTLTGADVLIQHDFRQLYGKSVGLVTNAAATNNADTSLIVALTSHPLIELKALFTPEHGYFVNYANGIPVDDQSLMEGAVPVYSLYGNLRKPNADMLDGIDALVFDVQEVGARFYTYISTLALTMEAAAEANIEYFVLDRPNPVSALGVRGPVLDHDLISFIGIAPLPIMHGLTIGELANMLKGERWINGADELRLTVIPMKNWRHSMFFEETGLRWLAPSPNIPDIETALLYPGMGLIEATNLSEGRGTMAPFKTIGAPWLDNSLLINELSCSGIVFKRTEFIPRNIKGMANNPKYVGSICPGIRLEITDRRAFDPVNCALALISHIRDLYPERLEIDPVRMAKMLGSKQLVKMLQQGDSIAEMTAFYQDDLTRFNKVRKKYLLYK